MTTLSRRIGLDRRRSGIYLADVDTGGERLLINALRRVGENELTGQSDLSGGHIAVSLPDQLAQVKAVFVAVDSRFPVSDQVAFELTQSLLEPADRFTFDSINCGMGRRHLGFITRTELIDETCQSYRLPDAVTSGRTLCARTRALALGLGYLYFCQKEGGELVALVDLAGTTASIALILGGGVVGVAWLPIGRFDLGAESGREKLAVELKTLINYNLSSLMTDGISQPLTALLVGGDNADNDVSTALDRYFSGLVRQPRLQLELFAHESTVARGDGHRFVVALGLTVE